MNYGITGNTRKEKLWRPVSLLVEWLRERKLSFCLGEEVARGLVDRGLSTAAVCQAHSVTDLAETADVVLSFGGDGTLLNSANTVGVRGTPILGINIGRLGFLADVEVAQLHDAIERIEAGAYRIEPRMVLEAQITGREPDEPCWALNEFVIDKSGSASMIAIRVSVDERFLNTYWTDGLIFSTPTGSTAYSLSAGGPIIAPGSGVLVVTPIAPHTLTVRPIVLPATAEIEVQVTTRSQPFVFAADGRSEVITPEQGPIRIRRAAHTVNLVKLDHQDYFSTLRRKLAWGQGLRGEGTPD